jgi:hypothetical protein
MRLGKSLPCQAGSWLALSVYSDQDANNGYSDSRRDNEFDVQLDELEMLVIIMLWVGATLSF